jgi:hypothetical protein
MTPLRQRMMEDMQIRNLSANTQASYLLQVSQFARHFAKSPAVLSAEDVRTVPIRLTHTPTTYRFRGVNRRVAYGRSRPHRIGIPAIAS